MPVNSTIVSDVSQFQFYQPVFSMQTPFRSSVTHYKDIEI